MTPLDFEAFDIEPGEIDRRFALAARSGHPAWLWPEVERQDWRDALVAIEGATRTVLTGADSPRITAPGTSVAFGVAAYTSGMGPLLGYWLRTGRLAASSDTAAILDLHLRHNEARMDRLAAAISDAVRALTEEGILVTPLKGMHTAFAYFPDPATRPVSDIDLLVPAARFDDAERTLARSGHERLSRQSRPPRAEWRRSGDPAGPRSIYLTHAHDPYSIDLHGSLDRDFFGVGTVEFDAENAGGGGDGQRAGRGDTLPRPRSSTVGPGQHAGPLTPPAALWSPGAENVAGVHPLNQPLLTLFLAAHASEGLHNLTMIRLTELALVIDRDVGSGALDWDELVWMARRSSALRFAWPAIEVCERFVPGLIPSPVLDQFRVAATPAMRRIVGSLSPATAQRIDAPLSLEERLMWAGSVREHIRRMTHGLWPAPAGRSLRRLGGIYRQRAWRLMRGTVAR